MFTTLSQPRKSQAAAEADGPIAPSFREGLGLALRAGILSGLVGPPIGLLLFLTSLLAENLSQFAGALQPDTTIAVFRQPVLIVAWSLLAMLPLIALGLLLGLIAGLTLGIPLAGLQSLRGRRLPKAAWILPFGLFGLFAIPVAFDLGPGGVDGWIGIPGIAPYSWFGMLGGIAGSAIALRMEGLGDGRILPRPWLTPAKLLLFGSHGIGWPRLGAGNLFGGRADGSSLDARWLEIWSDIPAWSPEAARNLDSKNMADDHHETILCEAGTAELLAAAGAELLRYRFYPAQVADALGEFDLEDRAAQDGDRVLQRLHILGIFGRPILDILSLVQVLGIEAGPERWTFGYVTTERHPGRGWWQVALDLDAEQRLRLTMTASAAPAWGRISGLPGVRAVYRRLMRHFQARAHRRGIEAFRARVQGLAEAAARAETAEASESAAAAERSETAITAASKATEARS